MEQNMFVRLVHAGLRPETLSDLQRIYDEKFIPRLEKVPGCLYVGLIAIEPKHDEGFSLTLWDSYEHLEAYEQSGLYQESLEEARPYLSGSSVMKLQLSKDLNLEYVSVPEDPTVKSYASFAQTEKRLPEHGITFLENLRLVTVKILPGKMEEYRRIYTEEIIPALQSVRGCNYAFLTEGLEEKNEVISITFWDSRQDMENYEKSGLFDELKNKLKHLYSRIYQWKLTLEKDTGKKVATSEDLSITYYSYVTGMKFHNG